MVRTKVVLTLLMRRRHTECAYYKNAHGGTATMQNKHLIIYVWPGLPHIWTYGSWSALAVAVAAAGALSAVIVGNFGWTELIDPGVRKILWASLGILWIGSAIISAVKLRRRSDAKNDTTNEEPFNQAIDVYLKGDYYQAERLLDKLLERNERDLDARLMLATLLRHTGRIDDAAEELDILTRFDGSEKWELEIYKERELLAEARKNAKDNAENGTAIARKVDPDEILRAA
jgi:tetratricopeptide (TPR) repeat protein